MAPCYADYGYVYEDWNLQYQEQCQPYANYVVPNFYMEEEDLERITELSTPLDDYARSMEAQFTRCLIWHIHLLRQAGILHRNL